MVLAEGIYHHRPNIMCLEVTDSMQRFVGWWTRRKPVDVWFDILKNAQTYEEWEEAAFQLDVLLGNDLWSVQDPIYNVRSINIAMVLIAI
jgi:hypothetical protein